MYRIERKSIGKKISLLLLLLLLVMVYLNEWRGRFGEEMKSGMGDRVVSTCFPIFSFVNERSHETGLADFVCNIIMQEFPIYHYAQEDLQVLMQTESADVYQLIEQMEGREEESRDGINVDDEMNLALLEENQRAKEDKSVEADAAAGEFIPSLSKAVTYNMEDYRDFDRLMKEFYVVDSTTMTDSTQLNIDKLLGKDMRLQNAADKPQILIYHTHSQEDFIDSVPGDKTMTIMGAGERLAQILREKYGFNVVHHEGEYDVVSRDNAYTNAAPGVEKVLAENPSIEVVIDLHRDEVKEDRKLVVDQNGKPTATFMFFNGLSRTKQTGDIAYLQNPYIDDNLAFSFQMQLVSNEYYPGITRKIYLKGYRYNMHYKPKTLLIELGAQTNTVEEIMNACEPLAHILSMVLTNEGET